jgi:hypothetical protein
MPTVMGTGRSAPVSLGSRHWGGHEGELSVTPTSYPRLSALDDLTVFRWTSLDGPHAVGINVWAPFRQSVQTLHALVDRLARVHSRSATERATSIAGISMKPTPRWVHELCSTALTRLACPTKLPAMHEGFVYVTTAAGRTRGRAYDQISVEWVGNNTGKEGTPPPNFGHFDITAGHLVTASRDAPAQRLDSIHIPLQDPLHPIPIGDRSWTTPKGKLIFGDCFANHICYRWQRGGHRYQIDLHAWPPLTQTAAVLHAIVQSTPSRS